MQQNNEYYNLIAEGYEPWLYDLLLYESNTVLHDYSDHRTINTKNSFKKSIRNYLRKYLIRIYRALAFQPLRNVDRLEPVILSNAYVRIDTHGIKSLFPPWAERLHARIFTNRTLAKAVFEIEDIRFKRNFLMLHNPEFLAKLGVFEKEFIRLINQHDVRAIIVPNDLALFENFSIRIAKKCRVPSFVYLHGLPARYNYIDDNRADYLIVWGKGIKENYVKAGVNPKKILALKHPFYHSFEKRTLRSSFDNIVVLSKSVDGTPSSSTIVRIAGRNNSLLYLVKLKKLLIQLGVGQVTLRIHPSETPDFYRNNLDDFFILDQSLKSETLKKATLLIGPSSTMVLDAIQNGVNYILFEPIVDGLTLDRSPIVSPFDGNSFVKLSNSLEQIVHNIKNPEINIDFDCLNKYFFVDSSDQKKFYDVLNKR